MTAILRIHAEKRWGRLPIRLRAHWGRFSWSHAERERQARSWATTNPSYYRKRFSI
jgi:hypothetical protein